MGIYSGGKNFPGYFHHILLHVAIINELHHSELKKKTTKETSRHFTPISLLKQSKMCLIQSLHQSDYLPYSLLFLNSVWEVI